jgi:hypothetical protein
MTVAESVTAHKEAFAKDGPLTTNAGEHRRRPTPKEDDR